MNELKIALIINDEGASYKASGNMTLGLVKQAIGELELIKKRLLDDLEKSLEKG